MSDTFIFKCKQSSVNLIRPNTRIMGNAVNNCRTVNQTVNLKVYGFKDVVLSQVGSIHSGCWDITTTGGCKCGNLPKLSIYKRQYPRYDKVISITHYWGNAVFHSIAECLTKLGYYIPELLKDESIKIHAYRSASIQYLRFLGFSDSRIIYGDVYAKRLLSLERGGCGSPPPMVYTQSFRNYIRNKITSKPRYDIVLIKRYGNRDIINFKEVHNTLQNKCRSKKIAIFYPKTPFKDTLNYFKYAKVIVAPHGAGLSNMVISEDCKIIEFLSGNLCYSSLAINLGLGYYGIYQPIIKGKFLVNITLFERILDFIKIENKKSKIKKFV